jgi:hypothetical protein
MHIGNLGSGEKGEWEMRRKTTTAQEEELTDDE